ncbi:MAG: hypothetical protein MHMPM18_004544 [Marteilia pararefringens]
MSQCIHKIKQCFCSCCKADIHFKARHSRYQSTIRIIMLIRLIPIWLVIIPVQMHIHSGESELFRRVLIDQYEGCKLAWRNYKKHASKDILNYDSQELRDHCEYTPKDAKTGLAYISSIMAYVSLFSCLSFKFWRKVTVHFIEMICLVLIIFLQTVTYANRPYSLAKSLAIYSYFGGTKEYEFVRPSLIIISLNFFDIISRCCYCILRINEY